MNDLLTPPRIVAPQPGRPYQERAIVELRQAISEMVEVNGVRRRRRPVLSLPTGGGKTWIASSIIRMARDRGRSCAFVVPLLSLIPQTYRAFTAAGIDHIGVMQGQNELTDSSAPVQICSAQTLLRRKLPDSDVVIVDEAHLRHKAVLEWMRGADPRKTFIGLSATPWAAGMAEDWDQMIVVETVAGLIEQGYLSPFRAFAPSHPDLSGVKVMAGDYHEGQLGEAMSKPKLVADVVRTYLEKAEMRPAFVFCVNRIHAKLLQEQFLAQSVAAAYVDAFTPVEEREAIISKLKTGEFNVICNIGTMTTGVDAPFVSCIQLARPTKSEMLFLQMVGRGLRVDEGKADLLLLDHSNTIETLGMPDEIEHAEFVVKKPKGEAEERKKPLPKPCPACTYLLAPGTRVCPACGFEPTPRSPVEMQDGELEEVRGGKKKKTKEAADHDTKQRWFSGLLYIARERGYKDGWAANKYREKFEVWPRGLSDQSAFPDAAISSWVKASQIRWAKRREKDANHPMGNER